MSKIALLGAAMPLLAACGGGNASKVEEMVETCWAPGVKAQAGLSDIKIGEIQVMEEKLSPADEANGFTWVASVLIKYTYLQTAGGSWQNGMRMPSAAVREGKLRLERADGIKCETDA
ncbi:MAG: hypothetical protein QM698_13410 [Micropepsaceae bacterium]